MYVFSARPFENHLCERLPCLKIINNNNNNNTSIYERAYERDSHKHANTIIYERAYERDSHKAR